MLDEDLLRLILRNVRTPDERRGDLAAQTRRPLPWANGVCTS